MPVLWDNGEKTAKSQKNRPALLAIPKRWCIVCVLPKNGVSSQPAIKGLPHEDCKDVRFDSDEWTQELLRESEGCVFGRWQGSALFLQYSDCGKVK